MSQAAAKHFRRFAAGFLAFAAVFLLDVPNLFAKTHHPAAPAEAASALTAAPSGPASALSAALSAACRQDSADFSAYLTDANAAAFRNLSANDRLSIMERFVLIDTKGRPLLSTNLQGQQFFICEGGDSSQKFTLGASQVHDHLAYIPLTSSGGETVKFGLVREDGNWKLLSIGLLLIDIPQLQKEWAAQDLKIREQSAIETLRGLANAVSRYNDAFGKLPQNLAQLGPPDATGISPNGAKLISAKLASGVHDGYEFRYRSYVPAGSQTSVFEIAATPVQYGKTGKRSFLLDQHGYIHAADHKGALATTEDPLVPVGAASTP